MSAGTLEEVTADSHATAAVGSELCVSVLTFTDKYLLEPGCSVLFSPRCVLRSGCWRVPEAWSQ